MAQASASLTWPSAYQLESMQSPRQSWSMASPWTAARGFSGLYSPMVGQSSVVPPAWDSESSHGQQDLQEEDLASRGCCFCVFLS